MQSHMESGVNLLFYAADFTQHLRKGQSSEK